MEQSVELLSTAALKQRGLRPKTGEMPAKIETWQNHGSKGVRHLWRLDQATEIKSRVLAPIHLEKTPENILLAIWSVNRAAKRRRDAAESSYEKDLHGFAGAHKSAKDRYYRLKDIGIAWLAHHGHLAAAYRHGQLVVWVGGGYSFHSTLVPHGAELAEAGDNLVRMEAKPAGSKELRLIDAQVLLGSLASVVTNYARIATPWVRQKRERRRSYDDHFAVDRWDDDEDEAIGPELQAIYSQQALIEEQSKQAKRLWPEEWAEALTMPKPMRRLRLRYLRAKVAGQMSAQPVEAPDAAR